MKKKFLCIDKYEAKKLATLIFIKEGNETFITEILDVIENEIIVGLKDKSAHSILLKDHRQAEEFTDFMQSVIEKQHKITDTKIINDEVEIEKRT
ncbi:MAG: hypothetical protein ACT4OW_05505 [Nitrososphaerota archaeon]